MERSTRPGGLEAHGKILSLEDMLPCLISRRMSIQSLDLLLEEWTSSGKVALGIFMPPGGMDLNGRIPKSVVMEESNPLPLD